MASKSVFYRGKRVSAEHYAIFMAYEAKYGVAVQLNQGRRTIPEQAAFYAHYLRYGHPLAARPFPGAPHIKYGQANHANDINAGSGFGQAQHVAQFYRSLGIAVAFNVGNEPWHMDTLNEGELVRAANKLRVPPTLKLGSRGSQVKELQKDLRAVGRWKGRVGKTFGARTRSRLKGYQKSQGLKADGVYGPNTRRHLEADAKRARNR